jgi:hypothetical protein
MIEYVDRDVQVNNLPAKIGFDTSRISVHRFTQTLKVERSVETEI